ncbi:uncharacterized protein LOC122093905 [Macadamia integrifolia]|uniref:uncharacterized protein LOC122093905 n=1 Tax=Macadamia integrifolia TaxID=60698 RepID=UPI001C527BA1|nr:uncharacterized protein LOC122093905 [Macadamia integrifolia]
MAFQRMGYGNHWKYYPPSSQGHSFILVATDYFIKWVEAIPIKVVSHVDVMKFLKQIIQKFGIPETITCDNGSMFIGDLILEFAMEHRITIIHSTSYYTRGTTPFSLTFGHDAVLPMEVTMKSLRVAQQHSLTPFKYSEAMLTELCVKALNYMQAQNMMVTKAYDKRVKPQEFREGPLVWKAILPIGAKTSLFGKWSPMWEGPFEIYPYRLQDLNRQIQLKPINEKYLKRYLSQVSPHGSEACRPSASKATSSKSSLNS